MPTGMWPTCHRKKFNQTKSFFFTLDISWSATEERLKAVRGITESTAVPRGSVPKPSRKERSLESLGCFQFASCQTPPPLPRRPRLLSCLLQRCQRTRGAEHTLYC